MDAPPQLWREVFFDPVPAHPVDPAAAREPFDYYKSGAPVTILDALIFELYRAALVADTVGFKHLAAWLDAVYDEFAGADQVRAAQELARGELPEFEPQNVRDRYGRPALWIATFGAFESANFATPETVRTLVQRGADPFERFIPPGDPAGEFVTVLGELEAAGASFAFFADLAAAAKAAALGGRVVVG